MGLAFEKLLILMTFPAWLSLGITLCAPLRLKAVVTVFGPVPYAQRSDSPFYSGIQNGTLYLEDFEDRLLNIPGVSIRNGGTAQLQGVDEDDGILNNRGTGTVWATHSGYLGDYGEPWMVEIKFDEDPEQGYPEYAGMALLGFTTFPGASAYYLFRAY